MQAHVLSIKPSASHIFHDNLEAEHIELDVGVNVDKVWLLSVLVRNGDSEVKLGLLVSQRLLSRVLHGRSRHLMLRVTIVHHDIQASRCVGDSDHNYCERDQGAKV